MIPALAEWLATSPIGHQLVALGGPPVTLALLAWLVVRVERLARAQEVCLDALRGLAQVAEAHADAEHRLSKLERSLGAVRHG